MFVSPQERITLIMNIKNRTMVYKSDKMSFNLHRLAIDAAEKNKNYIRRVTDNEDCARNEIYELMVKATGKNLSEMSEEESEKYWDATYWGYRQIEDFLNFL